MLLAPIRLTPGDADRYAALRKRMLANAPWAFAAIPEDDLALDLAHLRSALAETDNAIIAIEATEASGSLAAAAGIYRMKNHKFSHRAKLWGVFVDSPYRGHGLGRAVTSAALELARNWSGVSFIDVAVSANAPEAFNLYQSLGFVEWGREPETTQHNGRRYDEFYMSLRIE